jgi:hypothetical protein
MVVVRYKASLYGADPTPACLPLFDHCKPGDIRILQRVAKHLQRSLRDFSQSEAAGGVAGCRILWDWPAPACRSHLVDLPVRLLFRGFGICDLPLVLGPLLWREVMQA